MDLDCGKCSCGAIANVEKAWVPRIIAGERSGINEVKLIVVGKNPGHPIPAEAERYRQAIELGSSSAERALLLFNEMVAWGEFCHLHPEFLGRNGRYHANLMRFLKDTLGLANNDAVLDHVYFTELQKCSTEDEQGKLKPKLARRCISNWLLKELELLPKVPILALGRESERFLKETSDISSRVIYLHHPSYGIRNYQQARAAIQTKIRQDAKRP